MAKLLAHIALVCFALSCSIGLNGCSVDVPKHKFGFWQGKLNYLTEFQYYYKGLPAKKAILNSCSDKRIPPSMVCGGHGRCRSWNDLLPGQSPGTAGKLVAFCECNKYWADPECRTPRKSQSVAYFLSLSLGMLGADQFYLGFWTYGWTKLCSLGGLGLWYMFDVVRIGSYPVSTIDSFRVASDLPHYVFVVSSFSVMLALGFGIGLAAINHERKSKAHELVLMRKDEEDVIDDDADADLIRRLMKNARENEPLAVTDEKYGATWNGGYGSTNNDGSATTNINTLVRNAQGVDDAASNPQPAATSQVYSAPPGSMAVPSTLPPSSMPPAAAQTQPGSMAVPSTLSPRSIQTLSRSFRPAQTLPPQAGTMSFPPQAPVRTLPPSRVASAPIPSNTVLTEYSVPRAVMTVPGMTARGTNTMNLTTTLGTAEPVD